MMIQKPPLLHKLRYLKRKNWPVFPPIQTYKPTSVQIKLKTPILTKKIKSPKTQNNPRTRSHFMFPKPNTTLEAVLDRLETVAVGLQPKSLCLKIIPPNLTTPSKIKLSHPKREITLMFQTLKKLAPKTIFSSIIQIYIMGPIQMLRPTLFQRNLSKGWIFRWGLTSKRSSSRYMEKR